MEVILSRIQVWWKNGGKYQKFSSGGRIEVNISKIQILRKNGGKHIRYTGLEEEWREIYLRYVSGGRMEVNVLWI